MVGALLWIHLLCMIGTFGGLMAVQLIVPSATRNTPEGAKGAAKLFSVLVGIGLIFGLVTYVMGGGMHKGPHYNMLIGIKFVILLVVGALLGMSGKPGKGDVLRTLAMIFLAIAALFGTSLMPH